MKKREKISRGEVEMGTLWPGLSVYACTVTGLTLYTRILFIARFT